MSPPGVHDARGAREDELRDAVAVDRLRSRGAVPSTFVRSVLGARCPSRRRGRPRGRRRRDPRRRGRRRSASATSPRCVSTPSASSSGCAAAREAADLVARASSSRSTIARPRKPAPPVTSALMTRSSGRSRCRHAKLPDRPARELGATDLGVVADVDRKAAGGRGCGGSTRVCAWPAASSSSSRSISGRTRRPCRPVDARRRAPGSAPLVSPEARRAPCDAPADACRRSPRRECCSSVPCCGLDAIRLCVRSTRAGRARRSSRRRPCGARSPPSGSRIFARAVASGRLS